MEIEDDFRCYIDAFKYLDVSEKKRQNLKELQSLLIFLKDVYDENQVKVMINKFKEELNIDPLKANEDQYQNAVFIYTNLIQELLARCLSTELDENDKLDNEL